MIIMYLLGNAHITFNGCLDPSKTNKISITNYRTSMQMICFKIIRLPCTTEISLPYHTRNNMLNPRIKIRTRTRSRSSMQNMLLRKVLRFLIIGVLIWREKERRKKVGSLTPLLGVLDAQAESVNL